MECFCHLRNVQDLLTDGKTPDERRFGAFGTTIEYHPNSSPQREIKQEFIKLVTVLPGIFQGYALIAGGLCKGDILIADIEELENLDASDICFRRTSPGSGRDMF